MITSINSNNSIAYQDLFEKATKALREYAKELLKEDANLDEVRNFLKKFPGVDPVEIDELANQEEFEAKINEVVIISTLNDYFCNIEELARLDTMYVVLPVDEDTFNIDANSRAIAVPASFKKNGVGIQGDHTAEIVYFVIDRYFDNTDLAEQSMKIMIQYETAGGVKNSVPAFIRDVSSIQNKLIFGWILTEDITKVPGTVKFSVRFYKTVDDAEGNPKLIYSFSTLNSQITINRALDFDVASFDPDQNVSDLILNRLTNSKADGAVEAQLPIFIINLPESGKVDLKDADGIDDDGTSYTFAISASSPDAGFISYYWYRNDGNTVERIPEENTGFVYLETEDDIQHLNPLKIYYTVDSDGEYHRYIPSDTGYSELILYERRAYCKVDKVGEYYAVVENKVGTSTKELISNKVEVPKPTMPNADTIIIADYDILTLYGWDEEVKYVRATKETDEEVETLSITA